MTWKVFRPNTLSEYNCYVKSAVEGCVSIWDVVLLQHHTMFLINVTLAFRKRHNSATNHISGLQCDSRAVWLFDERQLHERSW